MCISFHVVFKLGELMIGSVTGRGVSCVGFFPRTKGLCTLEVEDLRIALRLCFFFLGTGAMKGLSESIRFPVLKICIFFLPLILWEDQVVLRLLLHYCPDQDSRASAAWLTVEVLE
eukprot:UN08772